MQKAIKAEYDAKTIGEVSVLTQAQINGLNSNSVRLRNDLVYVVPRQKVHSEKISVRGTERNSNKVFAFGCVYDPEAKTLTPVTVTTLSINGLRQRHYGFVENGPVKALAEQRDGLWRMKAGQGLDQISVFKNGGVTVHIDGTTATVEPINFAVVDRKPCHTIGMTENADGKYDFNHKKDGKDDVIEFQATDLNVYEEVFADTSSLGDLGEICDDFKKFAA